MLKNTLFAFGLALQNIRANLLHTVLSVLGIVIGVAALVAILSFIDGMEKYAREQISGTTDLHSIVISTHTSKKTDGVWVKKEEYGYFTYDRLKTLEAALSHPAAVYAVFGKPQAIPLPDSGRTIGVAVLGVMPALEGQAKMLAGRFLTDADMKQKERVAVVNRALADKLVKKEKYEQLLGSKLQLQDGLVQIVGVAGAGGEEGVGQVAVPLTLFPEDELKASPPVAFVEAGRIEDISDLKVETEAWLKQSLARNEDDFTVATNEGRVEQMEKGVLIFKLIMGLITGISVIVGGIGIMNVLLISVTERTVEIGIRKAMGAKRRDIMLLFLSESITVSGFGSLLVVLLGVLGTLAVVPIIQYIAEVPFEAAFTLGTMLTIAVLALLLGVVFGTYPALRAARLDPVEAIRRE